MDSARDRFEVMVNALSRDIFRYAYWLCRDHAMAEDLTQETFMRAWRSFSSLRDESKAKSWLITTVRREFARQFERYRPRFENVDLTAIPDARENAETRQEIRELRREVAKLPEKYREPLVLQVIGGFTGDEIGAMLDLPRATVLTRLFRARQKLTETMREKPISTSSKDKVS